MDPCNTDAPSSFSERVDLIYDFQKVDGSVIRTPQKKTSSISFQELQSKTVGGEVIGDNAIYVRSRNLAYFRVDKPEMLDFILKYHSNRSSESAVIVVRPVTQSSPNTSPLRNTEGVTSIPDSVTQPTQVKVNIVDPLSQEEVQNLAATDVTRLSQDQVKITVETDSLVQFLQHAESTGQSVFDLELSAYEQGGQMINIDFSRHELWFQCLCRANNEASLIREIFMDSVVRIERHNKSVKELQANTVLWHKLLNFARDAQVGYKDENSAKRLEAASLDPIMRYYFSTVHFTESEVAFLMDFPALTGEKAEDVLARMVERTKGELCTSHTLFPMLRQIFGIPNDLLKNGAVMKRYELFKKAWNREMKKRTK